MKIRSKLAWTFALLLIVGISTVCSYSIIYIKNYFNRKGTKELKQSTHSLGMAIASLPNSPRFHKIVDEIARTSGYQVALYDTAGILIYSYPAGLNPANRLAADKLRKLRANAKEAGVSGQRNHNKQIVSFIYMPQSSNAAHYARISQSKKSIYTPVKKIRWIIYYGIFASALLAIIVSIWIARYLTRPITQIKDTAQNIADGDTDQQIDVNRHDEFGTLADSLNKMAAKLRNDTIQMRRYAERQRQFFADITHEIRNPLHTISASLEMLELDGLSDEKRSKYFANAKSQIQRINQLFKDLKTLQQYDSDEYFVEEKAFDIAEISQNMKEWYGKKACEKSLGLSVDMQSCYVSGDPNKIEQVLDNLISNAIKYTNKGSVDLHYQKNGETVMVEVRDTGPGIPNEHLERIFDRFYRTDKARSRETGGTGLGLAVVRSILRAHNTDIEVESEPGKGTLFRFSLPRG
jgi:signal transduction histidine kinase